MLILEPTKIYQPSYLSINKDVEDNTVSIWHVAPDDKVGPCLPACLVIVLVVAQMRVPCDFFSLPASLLTIRSPDSSRYHLLIGSFMNGG